MTPEGAMALIQRALLIAVLLSAPMLVFGLVAGVLVSLIQAVTQIQEMTLTFIPKLLAIVVALFIFGQWILLTLVRFTGELLVVLPQSVR